MYTCVYIYIYIYIHTYIHTYIHACVYIYIYIHCTHIHVHIHMYVYIYIYVHNYNNVKSNNHYCYMDTSSVRPLAHKSFSSLEGADKRRPRAGAALQNPII